MSCLIFSCITECAPFVGAYICVFVCGKEYLAVPEQALTQGAFPVFRPLNEAMGARPSISDGSAPRTAGLPGCASLVGRCHRGREVTQTRTPPSPGGMRLVRSRPAAAAVRAEPPPGCPGYPGALRWERAPGRRGTAGGQGKCRCHRRFPVVLTGDSWKRHVPSPESGEKPLAPPVPGWINGGQREAPGFQQRVPSQGRQRSAVAQCVQQHPFLSLPLLQPHLYFDNFDPPFLLSLALTSLSWKLILSDLKQELQKLSLRKPCAVQFPQCIFRVVPILLK